MRPACIRSVASIATARACCCSPTTASWRCASPTRATSTPSGTGRGAPTAPWTARRWPACATASSSRTASPAPTVPAPPTAAAESTCTKAGIVRFDACSRRSAIPSSGWSAAASVRSSWASSSRASGGRRRPTSCERSGMILNRAAVDLADRPGLPRRRSACRRNHAPDRLHARTGRRPARRGQHPGTRHGAGQGDRSRLRRRAAPSGVRPERRVPVHGRPGSGDRRAVDGRLPVRLEKDLDQSLKNKHVVLVEDIVDTGLTMRYLLQYLEGRGPLSVKVASLLSKPSRRRVDVPVHYLGFEIEDAFVYGYGLDVDHKYRNLPFVTSMTPSEFEALDE